MEKLEVKNIVSLTKKYLEEIKIYEQSIESEQYLFLTFIEIIKVLKIAIDTVDRKINR